VCFLGRLKRTLTADSGCDAGEWEDDQEDTIRESAAESLLGLWTVNRAQERSPNSFSLDLRRLRKVPFITHTYRKVRVCGLTKVTWQCLRARRAIWWLGGDLAAGVGVGLQCDDLRGRNPECFCRESRGA